MAAHGESLCIMCTVPYFDPLPPRLYFYFLWRLSGAGQFFWPEAPSPPSSWHSLVRPRTGHSHHWTPIRLVNEVVCTELGRVEQGRGGAVQRVSCNWGWVLAVPTRSSLGVDDGNWGWVAGGGLRNAPTSPRLGTSVEPVHEVFPAWYVKSLLGVRESVVACP